MLSKQKYDLRNCLHPLPTANRPYIIPFQTLFFPKHAIETFDIVSHLQHNWQFNRNIKSMPEQCNANEHVLHMQCLEYIKTVLTKTQTNIIILGCKSWQICESNIRDYPLRWKTSILYNAATVAYWACWKTVAKAWTSCYCLLLTTETFFRSGSLISMRITLTNLSIINDRKWKHNIEQICWTHNFLLNALALREGSF